MNTDTQLMNTETPAQTEGGPRSRPCPLVVSARRRCVQTFVDLGMSPLCESYVPAERLGADGALLPAERPRLRALPAGAARGVRRGGGDLHGVRLLLVVLGLVGRARARRTWRWPSSASGWVPTAWWSSSRATTAICSSTSSSAASRRSGSSRRPTCRGRRAGAGDRDGRGVLRPRAGCPAGRGGPPRGPAGRQQRDGARARPERLRRRHGAAAWRRTAWSRSRCRTCCGSSRSNQFDTIYHEHFSYFSFLTARKVLVGARSRGLRRRRADEPRRLAAALRAARARAAAGRSAARVDALARARAARWASTRSRDTAHSRRGSRRPSGGCSSS